MNIFPTASAVVFDLVYLFAAVNSLIDGANLI